MENKKQRKGSKIVLEYIDIMYIHFVDLLFTYEINKEKYVMVKPT
jgi:hypothetical protein